VQGGVTLVTWRRPDVHNAVDASTARTSALAAEGLPLRRALLQE